MTDPSSRPFASAAAFLALLLWFTAGCGPTNTSDPAPDSSQAQPPAESSPAETSSVENPPAAELPTEEPPADPPAIESPGTANGITLSGRVLFDGPRPQRRAINMTKDPTCIKLHGDDPVLSEELIVGDDGGVQNAFVYIRRGAPKMDYPVPEGAIELDQKDCMYRPRVQGMLVGQTLKVLNSDPVTHNVRSFPVRNRAFNFGQPADSGPRERLFDVAEREIEIQCDIHPWMHAYLFVMDHPFFAVTDAEGKYSIAGLPAGDYSLAIWHEELGRQNQDVNVVDKDIEVINFIFQP